MRKTEVTVEIEVCCEMAPGVKTDMTWKDLYDVKVIFRRQVARNVQGFTNKSLSAGASSVYQVGDLSGVKLTYSRRHDIGKHVSTTGLP